MSDQKQKIYEIEVIGFLELEVSIAYQKEQISRLSQLLQLIDIKSKYVRAAWMPCIEPPISIVKKKLTLEEEKKIEDLEEEIQKFRNSIGYSDEFVKQSLENEHRAIKKGEIFNEDDFIYDVMLRAWEREGSELLIIVADSATRKDICNFLDEFYPTVGKTNLHTDNHPSSIKHRYAFCSCGKEVLLDYYTPGILDNNIDESQSGDCSFCGETLYFEPSYDDDDDSSRCVYHDNILVVGGWMKGYCNEMQKKEVPVQLENKIPSIDSVEEMYFIPNPYQKHLDSSELKKYIDCRIKLMNELSKDPEYLENYFLD